MELKDILTIVRPGGRDGAAIASAGALAAGHRARVIGLCLLPIPPLDQADCYAVGAAAVREVLSHMDRDSDALAEAAEAPFRQAMAAAGCEASWTRSMAGEAPGDIVLRARVADLVVMTRPNAQDDAGRQLAESLIRFSGAPCLLTPDHWDPFRPLDRIAVAWNGSREAKRAVDDALVLLRRAKAVQVLTVGEPAPAPAPQPADLVDHLARHGVTAQIAALETSAGGGAAALLHHCGAIEADLLVAGAFSRPPSAERWFGGTTWTLMTKAGLPVFMSR